MICTSVVSRRTTQSSQSEDPSCPGGYPDARRPTPTLGMQRQCPSPAYQHDTVARPRRQSGAGWPEAGFENPGRHVPAHWAGGRACGADRNPLSLSRLACCASCAVVSGVCRTCSFDRYDLAARAGRRGMGAGSRVRLRRALVRAGQPGQLWLVPAAQPDRPASCADGGRDDLDAHRGAWRGRDAAARHGHGAMAAMSGAALPSRCSLSAAWLRPVARPHLYRGWCRLLVRGYGSKTRRQLVTL